MDKRKEAVKETATPAVKGDKKAANTAATSSPAPAPKKAEKTPDKKVVPKPKPETKTVCFTDQKSGKKFCGEMTEVSPDKVAGASRRKS